MKLEEAQRRAPGWSRTKLIFGYLLVCRVVNFIFRVFYSLRVTGLENIPREGPVIFAANHMSHLDPPLVGSTVRDRPCAYLARAGLFKFKPFGLMIGFVGAIPLEQGGGAAGAIRAAMGELKAGRCVLVFPEGSRSPDGAMQEFQAGVLLLMRRTDASVVPVAVEGVFDAWPRSRRFPRLRGRVGVRIGPARSAESLRAQDPASALESLRREVETMRLALRGDLRARSNGRIPAPGPGDYAYWEREAGGVAPADGASAG